MNPRANDVEGSASRSSEHYSTVKQEPPCARSWWSQEGRRTLSRCVGFLSSSQTLRPEASYQTTIDTDGPVNASKSSCLKALEER